MTRKLFSSHVVTVTLLLLSIVALAAFTGCNGGGFGANPATVAVLATQLDTFSPRDIVVDKGTKVTWTNVDTDYHAVIVDPQNAYANGPNSDLAQPQGIPPQGKFSWTVPTNAASGTKWYYHCRFHGTAGNGQDYGTGMVGFIIVR
jgi:plastocyanin